MGFGFDSGQLVLGPRVHVWYLDIEDGYFSGQGGFVSAGLGAGVYLELGDLVRLVPEVTVVAPFVGFNEDGSAFGDGSVLVEGGLAVLFVFDG